MGFILDVTQNLCVDYPHFILLYRVILFFGWAIVSSIFLIYFFFHHHHRPPEKPLLLLDKRWYIFRWCHRHMDIFPLIIFSHQASVSLCPTFLDSCTKRETVKRSSNCWGRKKKDASSSIYAGQYIMSSPPLEIDGKPLSTAGASQLAMIWWYTAAINFKRRKKNSFLEWDRRWVPRSPSIYYYIYTL